MHEHAARLVGGPADEGAVQATAGRDLYGAPRPGGPVSVESCADSALALAAADLAARRAGTSLAEHLGAPQRDDVELYVTALDAAPAGFALLADPPARLPDDARLAGEDAAALARAVRAEGFGLLKLWPFLPGVPHERGLAALAAARATGLAIAVDLYRALEPRDARALARRLDALDLAWIEDPLPATDPAALARLARTLATPLVAGEALAGVDALGALARRGGLGLLHVDLGWCGGPRVALAAAAVAARRGLPTTLHGAAGPVQWAAGIHVARVLERGAPIECSRPALHGLFGCIAAGLPAVAGGRARPGGPGHGVALAPGYVDGAARRVSGRAT